MAQDYTIEEASYEDWKRYVDLFAESEQWSFGFAYEDFLVYKKAYGEDKSKFLAAKGTDGDVLGFICMTKIEPDITAIGMYYARPEHRGEGIGNKLFDQLTQDSKAEGRNLFLNGISNMSSKYASRKGFDKRTDWNISTVHIASGADTSKIAHLAGDATVLKHTDVNFGEIADYDRTIAAHYDRSNFVEAWLNHPTGWSKVAIGGNSEVIGYGTVRVVMQNRLVVGPLYANDKATAAALVKALLDDDENLAARQIEFFIPSSNKDAFYLIEKLCDGNCQEISYFVSQFTKKLVEIDVSKVFAVADYELAFA